MALPVYSKRLIVFPGFSGGPSLEYTVPSGVVTVVKCITTSLGTNFTPGELRVIHSPSGAVIYTFAGDTSTDETNTALGSWVLNAGEGLELLGTGTPTDWVGDFYISGYELST